MRIFKHTDPGRTREEGQCNLQLQVADSTVMTSAWMAPEQADALAGEINGQLLLPIVDEQEFSPAE
jgi:hypothetical protein